MKKKVLFIVSDMKSGGVSKSMSSLLNVIDLERYEIDCFVLSPRGIFMDTIPPDVRLIQDLRTELFLSNPKKGIFKLFFKGYFRLSFLRLMAAISGLFDKGLAGWFLSKGIFKIDTKYDVVVDYNGQHILYYMVDVINAKVKISFFHNDYEKWPFYFKMDKKYYPKIDHIFTVSEFCVKSLKRYFPSESTKIDLFPNILSKSVIEKLANESVVDPLSDRQTSILTVGHLSDTKGTKLALETAKNLKARNFPFRWYFIGSKTELRYYSKLATELGVEDRIVFMGLRNNPYPYFKQATLVVHPSKFEGKSIALDEAKLLHKPTVVTNFSTVYDQFEDRVNATICKMDVESLSNSIIELVQDTNLQIIYIDNLSKTAKDNTFEIEKLYHIIDAVK